MTTPPKAAPPTSWVMRTENAAAALADDQSFPGDASDVCYCDRCRNYVHVQSPPNPLWLHLVLAVITCGLWLPLWMRLPEFRSSICLSCGCVLGSKVPPLRLATLTECIKVAAVSLFATAAAVWGAIVEGFLGRRSPAAPGSAASGGPQSNPNLEAV